MKHAILDVPYVRFSSMCSDIDKWLRSSTYREIPLQKSIGRRLQAHSCAVRKR